jgi:hypothetical protein
VLRCPEADAPRIAELTDFIYACFVGILSQWLASRDLPTLVKTTKNLIETARTLALRLVAVRTAE